MRFRKKEILALILGNIVQLFIMEVNDDIEPPPPIQVLRDKDLRIKQQ